MPFYLAEKFSDHWIMTQNRRGSEVWWLNQKEMGAYRGCDIFEKWIRGENGIQRFGAHVTKRLSAKTKDTATPVGGREVDDYGFQVHSPSLPRLETEWPFPQMKSIGRFSVSNTRCSEWTTDWLCCENSLHK
jgi:hypothetical protein